MNLPFQPRQNSSEEVLLIRMQKELEDQLQTAHIFPAQEFDKKKMQYPVGVYDFDEQIDEKSEDTIF